MNRTQISIKLDTALLERIDQLAADSGVTRTAVIEKAVKNDLPSQESFNKALENPAIRALHTQLTKPGMLRLIAKLAGEEFTDAELEAMLEKAPRQRESAKRRKSARRGGGASPLQEGA